MLTPRQLASCRTTMNASLPGTAVIYRPKADTTNAYAGQSLVWPDDWTAAGTAAVRIERSSARQEAVAGGQVTASVQIRGVLPWNADVQAQDRLVVSSDAYEVQGPVTGESERTCHVVEMLAVS